MPNKLMTLCALVVCVPALAFAQAGGGAQNGGGNQGGNAAQDARTQQQRQRDSLILHQRAVQGDTGQANAQQQGNDTVTSSAGGEVAAGNEGLSKSDVKQLQTALDSLGCNAGPKDGIIGPKTRAAIACGEQKTSATGLQDLGQKLNLNLSPSTENASPNSGAAGGNARRPDTTGTNAVKGRRRQTSGQNAGRIRPVPTRSDTSANKSRNDTSAVQGQTGQQGTVDTTTSKGAIDTTFNQRDTTQMNRTDTTQMNRNDTTQMNRTDTTMLRDTTQMRDTTMLRDTTRMRDTSSTRTHNPSTLF